MSDDPNRGDVVAALVRIGNIFHTERTLERLLGIIVEETYRVMNAEWGSIFLLDEPAGEVWSKVATGLAEGDTIRMDRHRGIVGHVIDTGEPLIIPDPYGDPRFNPKVDADTGQRTRNILCVPLVTPQGRITGAFQVLNKRGAFDAGDQELLQLVASQACIAIENARLNEQLEAHQAHLTAENRNLRRQLESKSGLPAIVGSSPAIRQVQDAIRRVAGSTASVLITGETGTGKELVARSLHAVSPRAGRPYVPLNCGALPESLLEAELFGIEKGVATGVDARAGQLVQAEGGTVFLDEVGELPLSTQVKLLRALQERRVRPLGSRRETEIDIRVVSATNRDLKRAVEQQAFREDLFYRLNVFPIRLPALRERPEDIPLLARFILRNVTADTPTPAEDFSAASLAAMGRYEWPGNVRQLENLIRRAAILATGAEMDLTGLLAEEQAGAPDGTGAGSDEAPTQPEALDIKQQVRELEQRVILDALDRTRGNQVRAARLLGLSREGLRKKIDRYALDWPHRPA